MTNKNKEKTIFITGGAGFIGSHLSESLLKMGYSVVCIDNFNDFYDPAVKRQNVKTAQKTAERLNVSFCCIEGDIRNKKDIEVIFEKRSIYMAIHLAAMAGVRASLEKPELYRDVNINGTKNVLEISHRAGLKKFIFGSSSSVYGESKEIPFKESQKKYVTLSPYASTKRENELYCEEFAKRHEINMAILRFFTVYGPRQRPDMALNKFVRLTLEDKPVPFFGDGEMKRDYTYIDDIVSGVAGAIQWLGEVSEKGRVEVFNLASGKMIALTDLAGHIERALNKKIIFEKLEIPSSEMPLTYGDISKAKEAFRYQPKMSFDRGVETFVRWFKETS